MGASAPIFSGKHMKYLKITEAGYDNFCGHFGTIEFVDGVSTHPVTSLEALRMQALLRVESIGDEVDETFDMKVTFESAAPQRQPEVGHEPAPEAALAAKKWTRDELEAIADKHGIKGLREITSAMGISGKSISDLISAILAA